jgi:Fur family ferric uptake transcriptional regulator
MEKNRLRSTAQRRVVTQVFLESQAHLSIEELLQAVRKKDSKVGYATVYRTLKMLTDSGVASERHFGDGMSRYEVADDDHHDHLICTECNRIVEFENLEIESLQEIVAKDHGFVLSRHRHELYGLCASCQKS